MKKAVVIALLVLLMSFMTSGTTFVAQQASILEKYENTSPEQVLISLQTLPKAEFTQEVKTAFAESSQSDINNAIPFAAGLNERINEYSEDELISMITDSSNDLSFRVTLVQIYGSDNASGFTGRTAQGNETIRNLLLDSSVETILKENIIILLDFTDTAGKQMLQSIACEKDDMLAFQAIKKLNKFDSESAIDISKNILETYKTQTPEKVNAALKVMSEVYREARIQKAFTKRLELEKAAFIDLCSNIINTSEAGDKLQDCAILALSDMTDAQAITTIVENPNIDNSFKVYAIDQNYLTLTAMAESGSEEAIDIVCKAMEINPLKELSEPLSACQVTPMTRSENAVSEKTVKKANAAASRIALTGTNANPRWAQFYNEVN